MLYINLNDVDCVHVHFVCNHPWYITHCIHSSPGLLQLQRSLWSSSPGFDRPCHLLCWNGVLCHLIRKIGIQADVNPPKSSHIKIPSSWVHAQQAKIPARPSVHEFLVFPDTCCWIASLLTLKWAAQLLERTLYYCSPQEWLVPCQLRAI